MNRLRRACICGALAAATLPVFSPAKSRASASARPFCRFSLAEGWSDTGPSEYVTRRATSNDRSGVPQVVRRITNAFEIDVAIDILIAEQEDNAFALVAGGRKILIVDVGFLEKLNRIAGTQWAAIQVISHEVGHHIAGFSPDSHRNELNADYWSGQALQRLGAAQDVAASSILAVGSEIDTHSHPNKRRRAQVIRRGWTDAKRNYIDYSYCLDCR